MKSANMSATAGIDRGELDRLAFARRRPLEFARLHDRGMQIEIMRHDGRAEDADRDVEHARIGQNFGPRDETRPARRRRLGLEKKSSAAKQPPIVAMSVMTIASM